MFVQDLSIWVCKLDGQVTDWIDEDSGHCLAFGLKIGGDGRHSSNTASSTMRAKSLAFVDTLVALSSTFMHESVFLWDGKNGFFSSRREREGQNQVALGRCV